MLSCIQRGKTGSFTPLVFNIRKSYVISTLIMAGTQETNLLSSICRSTHFFSSSSSSSITPIFQHLRFCCYFLLFLQNFYFFLQKVHFHNTCIEIGMELRVHLFRIWDTFTTALRNFYFISILCLSKNVYNIHLYQGCKGSKTLL